VTLLLALSFLLVRLLAAVEAGLSDGSPAEIHSSAAFGWKLYVLAVGCGLIAYAGVDSEPGPAYVGVLVLGAFALLAGLPVATRGSLVGWPLFLLAIGAAGLAVGLRPRRPLPPEPPWLAWATPAQPSAAPPTTNRMIRHLRYAATVNRRSAGIRATIRCGSRPARAANRM